MVGGDIFGIFATVSLVGCLIKKSFIWSYIMIVVNTYHIAGKELKETKGLVTGSVVMSKHVGRDLMASVKTLFGGEIKGYTEMLTDARCEAQERMCEVARKRGANSVVNVRFTTSAISQGMSEVLAYGTAVVVE